MANPKNKWTRPLAPPAPMFFGEKERNLVKQINDELAERVLGQTIAYYPISIEESDFNDTYGESLEKTSLPPVRVFAYVVVESEQTNDRYGYEYQTKLTVNFHRKRLVDDQNLFVRVGDYVQYGDVFYEIVRTYNDTRYYFGQVEHKFQISAECVKAREGAFRVTPSVDRPTDRPPVSGEGQLAAPRPVPYPPLAATYITLAPERKLPNERVLTAGTGITLVDAGPGSSLTIAASSPGAAGIAGAVQLQDGSGVSEGSSNLVFLTGSNRLGIGTDEPDYTLDVAGDIGVDQYIYHNGDANTYINFSEDRIRFNAGGINMFGMHQKVSAPHQVTVNNGGNNVDFVVKDNSNNVYVRADASTSRLGIGTESPSHDLTIVGDVSASADVLVGGDLTVKGIVIGGSPLKIAGAIQVVNASDTDEVLASVGDAAGDGTIALSGSLIEGTNLTASSALVSTLTASTYVSSSWYYGDGRYLTNITASAVQVADGPEFSIQFRYDSPVGREISGSSNLTFITSSNTLSVTGDLSASANISASYFYGDGSNLTNVTASAVEVADGPEYSLQFRYDSPIGREISGSSNLTFTTASNTLVLDGDLSASSNVSASYFYGDGSNLTNITASAVEVADGPEFSIQFRYDSPIGREISGSSNLTFITASNTLSVTGDLSASANVSASAFYGDGSNLSGITSGPAGATTEIQYNDGGSLSASSNLTFDGTSLVVIGDLTASVNVSASAFYGDGSNLSGIAASAKGIQGSLQFKSSGAATTGSTALVYDITNNHLTVGGGLIHNRTSIATSHTASVSDYILGVTTVPTSILFDATTFVTGQVVVVKDETGNASGANLISLNASGSQTIDGNSSAYIESPYGSVLLYTDGADWFIY